MNTDTQPLSSTFSDANVFIQAFGDQLTAVYIYNRRPDDRLLLITTADADIHQLRAVFRKEMGQSPPPMIVPQPVLARQMHLFPFWAQAVQSGECMYGTPIAPVAVDITAVLTAVSTAVSTAAHWAQEAMEASAVLSKPQEMGRLRRLARQLLGRQVDDGETAVSLLAEIHLRLQKMMDDCGVPDWQTDRPAADAVLPGLLAGYRRLAAMVYVFDDNLPKLLAETDGETLLATLEQLSDGVLLVTSRQLQLSLRRESAAAFILQNYTHVWGANPLAGLVPDRGIVFRDAARKTAVYRTDTFINDYFLMPDGDAEAMHKLIHDFQNKLLNVQLEHELLYRLLKFERFLPADLPKRTAPALKRLDAIFEQLDWWSAQYAAKMGGRNNEQ